MSGDLTIAFVASVVATFALAAIGSLLVASGLVGRHSKTNGPRRFNYDRDAS